MMNRSLLLILVLSTTLLVSCGFQVGYDVTTSSTGSTIDTGVPAGTGVGLNNCVS